MDRREWRKALTVWGCGMNDLYAVCVDRGSAGLLFVVGDSHGELAEYAVAHAHRTPSPAPLRYGGCLRRHAGLFGCDPISDG